MCYFSSVVCCSFFLGPLYYACVANSMGENCCVGCSGHSAGVVPGGHMAMRAAFRNKHGIPVSARNQLLTTRGQGRGMPCAPARVWSIEWCNCDSEHSCYIYLCGGFLSMSGSSWDSMYCGYKFPCRVIWYEATVSSNMISVSLFVSQSLQRRFSVDQWFQTLPTYEPVKFQNEHCKINTKS